VSEPKEKKLIAESPQDFIRMAAVVVDSKELLSAHSLLHQWAQEIQSNSPTMEIGEHRWTLPWIANAHEATIRRLTQLKPKWQHDSPLTASAWALRPIILERGAVDIAGEGCDQISVHINSQILSEGALSQIAPHFEGTVKASYHANSPGGLYHLALIPISQWRELEGGRLTAAVTAFRSVLGPMATDPGLRKRVIEGMGQLEVLARESETRLDAEAVGIEMGSKVLSSDPIVPKYKKISAARIYTTEMVEAGMKMITNLLEPIEDYSLLDKGEAQLKAAIKKLRPEGRPSKAEAIDVARKMGSVIARKLKHG